MIKPHKYMDLEFSVVNVSSLIIKELKETKDEKLKYHELYKKICNEFNEEINELFLDSLNFLFVLGVIGYKKEKDFVELIR
ncbi:ABC-three component system middle component 8 [Selenihalanaerobacter shriftii]|uniref:Uncharacterized protein n=1 Tax=Selenihalanaerobacter shriftii TaxID=142842 RepID=A0A1T4JJ46_9FIRM|nr:ABC-three component system middle component 8 [Selenihalanaerobacter shriftii]SJZ30179.1 hypothetical protein SAMN02745118_00002 [Selenihalanaerobacter shriftii]